MMRITNSMMTSNTKNNINLNKLNEDKLNTEMATGQKITRPSDDPVIAIRALRLNTNLSQLNQYYDKNIPDANAWLKVTETALTQTDAIFTNIKENLTNGASDTNTPTDRQKILQNLKGLRAEVYSAGNADYAGRTVFTGYRTGEPLTFLTTDTDLEDNYKIHQELTASDMSDYTYVTAAGTGDEASVQSQTINRIRIAYDKLNETEGSTITLKFDETDPATGSKTTVKSYDLKVVSLAGKTQAEIDEIYTGANDNAPGYFIVETGEMIVSDDVADDMASAKENRLTPSIEYNKNEWKSGDLRPEHYFACEKTPKGGTAADTVQYNYTDGEPNFINQEIQVEVSFNQKITINTNANKVFTHDIVRDIDDLLKATEDVVDLDEKIAKVKDNLAKETDETAKGALQTQLDALNKEYALKKDKMQKMFSAGLDTFEGYADRNNVAIADLGSLSSRLKITRERVADQIQSFTELADDNINISLTDTAIDLSNAELALQAAQMAAGKIAQQTLLNYL